MPKLDFDPIHDVPDLNGKVIFITGGTAGLGYESALTFAAHNPAHIYISGRSQASADKLITESKAKHPQVPMTFIAADLASLSSVQEAARTFRAQSDRLDVFIANAGIMAVPPGQTKEDYEIQFGTNHVGHALLAKLLTPVLEATASRNGEARLIWVTSQGHFLHPSAGVQFDTLKTTQDHIASVWSPWRRYGQSKLANLLYARAFAKHHPNLTSVSIHPGVVMTGLVGGLSALDRAIVTMTTLGVALKPEQGAWNSVWAASAPLGTGKKEVQSGKYYEPVGVDTTPSRLGTDDELAERLWEWTQKELEPYSL